MAWLTSSSARLLVFVSVILPGSRAPYAPCPPGWLKWQQSCYMLLPDKMNWFQAAEACDRPRSGLAVSNTQEENIFIWQSIVLGRDGAGGLWIGCSDEAQEGVWLCGNQPAHRIQYTNWDATRFIQDNQHNCARMTIYAPDGTWSDDVPCSSTDYKSAACEMTAFNAAPTYHTFIGPDGRVPQQCLLHHGIQNITVDGLLACGWACWNDPRCRSFNLWQISKVENICQLNDATRLGADPTDFKATNNCFYFDL